MAEASFFEHLADSARKQEKGAEELEKLKADLAIADSEYDKAEKRWLAQKGELIEKIRAGEISTGDPLKDFTLVAGAIHAKKFDEMFSRFQARTAHLLDRLQEGKQFWMQTQHGPEPAFRMFYLGDIAPFTLAKGRLILNPHETHYVNFKEVFRQWETGEKTLWPFVDKSAERGEPFEVRIGGLQGYYGADLNETQTDRTKLENLIGDFSPLALLRFRELFGLDTIDSEENRKLRKETDDYVHEVATRAVKLIDRAYQDLRRADSKILEIEQRFGGENRQKTIGATHPEIPQIEGDDFLAAIMSHETVTERGSAWRILSKYMEDLRETRLDGYSVPIEVPVTVGQTRVYNLAEYAGHIRNVLEIGMLERTAKTG